MDLAGNPGPSAVRRQRGTRVAGGVVHDAIDTLLHQPADQHRRAAILERSARETALDLPDNIDTCPLAVRNRGHRLAQ